MRVGYARTSTVEQQAGFEAQLKELQATGCEKIFKEQVSSVNQKARTQLAEALDFIREGDTLVVTKIDRLARSVAHLLQIIDKVKAKKASLEVGGLGHIDGSPTGNLMITVLGAIAAFEREIMLERQKEGIATAKAEGKYKGRAPTARRQVEAIHALVAEGVPKAEIARRLGMHRTSVFRILGAKEAA